MCTGCHECVSADATVTLSWVAECDERCLFNESAPGQDRRSAGRRESCCVDVEVDDDDGLGLQSETYHCTDRCCVCRLLVVCERWYDSDIELGRGSITLTVTHSAVRVGGHIRMVMRTATV